MKIRIATRESRLALWQARHVEQRLLTLHPELSIELVGITTFADKNLETRLQKIGGKGLFVKELEEALLDGRADIAVHSMKDVPYQLPEGLAITTVLEREDPRDALVSEKGLTLESLAKGAVVGTSSLRRECQLKALRPDLVIKPLRGNVNTRLRKLAEGEFDAIVLAAAGLKRLEIIEHITQYFEADELLPAVGQGIIGIEARAGDRDLHRILDELADDKAAACIAAERAMNETLGGNCHLPVAGYATISGDTMHLTGLVGSVRLMKTIREASEGAASEPKHLGISIAQKLLEKGAREFIDEANQP